MLTIDIFHVSSLLLVAITFFIFQLGSLVDSEVPRVKRHLVACWIVTAVVVLSSFITIEVWG